MIVYATRYKAVPILKRELTAHYIIIIIIEEKNKNALKLNKTSNVKLNWQKAIDTGCACAIYNIDASVDVESCNDIKFGVIVAGYRLNVSVRSCGFPAAINCVENHIKIEQNCFRCRNSKLLPLNDSDQTTIGGDYTKGFQSLLMISKGHIVFKTDFKIDFICIQFNYFVIRSYWWNVTLFV